MTLNFCKRVTGDELVPFYNNLFGRVARELKLCLMNRSYFDPDGRITMPGNQVELWPGYVFAVNQFEGGLLLSCDSTFRVLRNLTVLDQLRGIYNDHEKRRNFTQSAVSEVAGQVILTRYNDRAYRIDDIDFKSNPNSEFTFKSGEKVTYVEYFRRHWNIEIVDLKQPLLIHRPRPKRGEVEGTDAICLIPELCTVTGMSAEMRNDFKAMRTMANYTKLAPDVRYERFVAFLKRINQHEGARKVLSDWGLAMGSFF